jgi:hypothetical protein
MKCKCSATGLNIESARFLRRTTAFSAKRYSRIFRETFQVINISLRTVLIPLTAAAAAAAASAAQLFLAPWTKMMPSRMMSVCCYQKPPDQDE